MGNDEQTQSSKSKQDRVRDNQRRSRARKQEHLAELEKRLAQCHSVCRDAALQKDAFHDLQVENARLRELLSLTGVSPALIQAYANQAAAPDHNGKMTLRLLKPKILVECAPTSQHDSWAADAEASNTPSSAPGSTYRLPSPQDSLTFSNVSAIVPKQTVSPIVDSFASTGNPLPASFSPGNLMPDSYTGSSCSATSTGDDPFCCKVFEVEAQAPLQHSSENTVLCSLAKDLIDQYNIEGLDLEEIKNRLATGFAPPSRPGESCRVNNQLLFEVLNDITSRPS